MKVWIVGSSLKKKCICCIEGTACWCQPGAWQIGGVDMVAGKTWYEARKIETADNYHDEIRGPANIHCHPHRR